MSLVLSPYRETIVRTVYFVIAGIAFLLLGSYFSKSTGFNLLKVLVPAWFVVAAYNMYIGVVKAGYGFGEEVPFFLVIFLVPVAVTWLVHKYFLQYS